LGSGCKSNRNFKNSSAAGKSKFDFRPEFLKPGGFDLKGGDADHLK